VDYEFEDIINEVDNVDLLELHSFPWISIGMRIVNRLGRHVAPSLAMLNPGIQRFRLKRNYDLFFAVGMEARDMISLNAIKGWRTKCRTCACWIDELWKSEVPKAKGLMKILSKYDYIFSGCYEVIELIQKAIQRPCIYIPPGIDTIRFCPYPNPPHRSIDVYSLGRRSASTHQGLLKMAEKNKIFYVYDTIHSGKMFTSNYREHRTLIANLAKRSRYFLTYPAKIDRHSQTGGQNEVGFRFFEGAASGAIMIGQPPDNQAFKEHFDWPDAVIPMTFNEPDVAKILNELDSQPERLAEIRKNGVVQSLLRHDWAYRWRAILDIVGLEPQPELVAREQQLKQLAEFVKNDNTDIHSYTADAYSR
jgi:hypothetical protein